MSGRYRTSVAILEADLKNACRRLRLHILLLGSTAVFIVHIITVACAQRGGKEGHYALRHCP